MSTRAGCECIAHMLQVRTDLHDRATVLSIDGIGAFNLVSSESMLRGLLRVEGGDSVLPFVRQFYASPSSCIWHDEHGIVHDVPQGEGGEQGDALIHPRWKLFRVSCSRVRRFAFSSTICTPSADLNELSPFST